MNGEVKKFAYIDALRGIAILLVVMIHASQRSTPGSEWLSSFMGGGAGGVQLFYVASALTLCFSWWARSKAESSPVRNFYIRRFFRIAPIFYLAIPVYLLINGFGKSYWAPNGIEWWFVVLTFAFLHGLHPETINSVVPGGWSIAVEMMFYAIFPFLVTRVNTLKKCFYLFLISIAFVRVDNRLMHHFVSYPDNLSYVLNNFTWLNFIGQLPVFVVGLSVFLAISNDKLNGKVAKFSLAFLPFMAFVYAYPQLTVSIKALDKLYGWQFGPTLSGLTFGLFAIALSYYKFPIFVNRFFISIGKLSYGIYLSHFAVLSFLKWVKLDVLYKKSDLYAVIFYFLTLALSYFVAKILHVFVESPGISFGKRLIEKLDGGPGGQGQIAVANQAK